MAYRYYLPESHDFEYIALAPWPQLDNQHDWVQGFVTLETWLEQYIGGHYQRWAWATTNSHNSSEACVAFKYDKHRCLFLLTWA